LEASVCAHRAAHFSKSSPQLRSIDRRIVPNDSNSIETINICIATARAEVPRRFALEDEK